MIGFVNPAQAEGRVKKAYDEIAAEYGIVPGYFLPLSAKPDMLDCVWRMYRETILSTSFDDRVRGLIRYQVAKADGCLKCRDGQKDLLMMHGLTDDEIQRLDQDVKSAGLDERLRNILIFSYSVAQNPKSIGEETISAFQMLGLSDEDLLQISAIVTLHKFLIDNMHALGTPCVLSTSR
jgi:alkylhydroperoxidase family enzyme